MRRTKLFPGHVGNQQVRGFVAGAEGVVAVADVLRAAVPGIAEIEYRVYRAGRVAPSNLARVDPLRGIDRIRIGEDQVGNRCGGLNAVGCDGAGGRDLVELPAIAVARAAI